MSRPRKPTAQLELVGAFKKDPQRRRDAEPQCTEAVMLPPVLSDNGKKAWEFLTACAVPGVLTKMDSAYLSLCAECLADIWWGDKPSINNRRQVGAMLGKLGMTPSERSNITVPKEKEKDPYGRYTKA